MSRKENRMPMIHAPDRARQWRMTLKSLLLVLCLGAAIPHLSCMDEAPVTGRSRLMILPSSQLDAMAFQQYSSFLKENRLSTDREKSAMIKRCGERIRKAVEQYFQERGEPERLKGYAWQFELVDDEQRNAWAMPGGRIVFYTGILETAQDETGVAVIMGHEIAHAVLEHGRERMSQQMLIALGGVALSQAIKDKPDTTKKIFMTAYGAGLTVGVQLRYSRVHEFEADYLGLLFMAMAGYDPREAPKFWQRMLDVQTKKAPPAWLSTHPPSQKRIEKLNGHMPEAVGIYRGTGPRPQVPAAEQMPASPAEKQPEPETSEEKPVINI